MLSSNCFFRLRPCHNPALAAIKLQLAYPHLVFPFIDLHMPRAHLLVAEYHGFDRALEYSSKSVGVIRSSWPAAWRQLVPDGPFSACSDVPRSFLGNEIQYIEPTTSSYSTPCRVFLLLPSHCAFRVTVPNIRTMTLPFWLNSGTWRITEQSDDQGKGEISHHLQPPHP